MKLDRSLYPFQSHYLDRNGLRLHYLDEGAGPPVVMLHGNPSWSFYYRELVRGLRHDYRCVVPDHLGCGLSDKPGDDRYDYRLQSRVDDLEALLDSLALPPRLTLVLHDWGGMIGLAWAHRHPHRLGRLVVLNTACGLLPESKPFPMPLRVFRNHRLGEWLATRWNAFAVITSRVGVRKRLAAAVRAGLVAPYDSPPHRLATVRFVQDIPLRPSDPSWPLVAAVAAGHARFRNVPTLICWGAHDFVFDHHFLRQWQEHFPQAQTHVMEDAGHYVLEDAADRIVPLVREFLAES